MSEDWSFPEMYATNPNAECDVIVMLFGKFRTYSDMGRNWLSPTFWLWTNYGFASLRPSVQKFRWPGISKKSKGKKGGGGAGKYISIKVNSFSWSSFPLILQLLSFSFLSWHGGLSMKNLSKLRIVCVKDLIQLKIVHLCEKIIGM